MTPEQKAALDREVAKRTEADTALGAKIDAITFAATPHALTDVVAVSGPGLLITTFDGPANFGPLTDVEAERLCKAIQKLNEDLAHSRRITRQ